MSLFINFLVVTILIIITKLKVTNSIAIAYPNENFANLDATSRISVGFKAASKQFKFMAGLGSLDANNQTTICGGALISLKAVLTSVLCVQGRESITVVLGATNLSKGADEPEKQIFVCNKTQVILPPNYDRYWVRPNIAIIKLAYEVTLSPSVQPVHIPTDDMHEYATLQARVFGWGKTTNNDQHTHMDTLRYAENAILTNEGCKRYNPFLGLLLDNTLMCFTGRLKKGVCRGDGGSPLVLIDSNILVGILSFGYKECAAGHAMAFTRLSKYIDWINANSG